jgi:hypothetical protein
MNFKKTAIYLLCIIIGGISTDVQAIDVMQKIYEQEKREREHREAENRDRIAHEIRVNGPVRAEQIERLILVLERIAAAKEKTASIEEKKPLKGISSDKTDGLVGPVVIWKIINCYGAGTRVLDEKDKEVIFDLNSHWARKNAEKIAKASGKNVAFKFYSEEEDGLVEDTK